eukprot:TRINITY_DN1780_c0_g1_i1.p2 TRINITY_DN1780_c0_g1~~TRINITY_DN1780_c0_g1_i1.p2  ORF type:complete len:249 (-),score=16.06 TRINITY_DN1780_c0_g1_i1:1786-2532(-)
MMREDQMIIDLLQTAVAKPQDIESDDGSAFLVLACHCFMVRWGFTLQDQSVNDCHSAYNPPKDWNVNYNTWTFRYSKDGKQGDFELRCEHNPETGRVHFVVEERGTQNVHSSSMKVTNYIVRPQDLHRYRAWSDVEFPSYAQRRFIQKVESQLMQPLCEAAEDTPRGYCTPTGSPRLDFPQDLVYRTAKKRRSLLQKSKLRHLPKNSKHVPGASADLMMMGVACVALATVSAVVVYKYLPKGLTTIQI